MHLDCISSFLVPKAQQEMKRASLWTLKVCIAIEQGMQYLKKRYDFYIFLIEKMKHGLILWGFCI